MRKCLITGAVCLLAVFCGNTWECRAEEVERQVVLKGVESEVGVPEEILVEYEGVEEYAPVKSSRVLKEYWTEDFEFPVLFYVYDAEYYELGELRIPRQEGTGLEEYKEELLNMLGLDGNDYVIEKITWDGDAYLNEEGILCRNAAAGGRKRVRDYELVYSREIKEIEPAGQPPEPNREERQMMVDAPERVIRAADRGNEEKNSFPDIWTVLKTVTLVTVAIQLVLLLLFLLILLARRLAAWRRERKEQKEEKKRKDIFDYYGG